MKTKILTVFVLFVFAFCGNAFACGAGSSSYSYRDFAQVWAEMATCKYCGRAAANAAMLRSLGPCPNSPSRKHVALRGRKTRSTYVCRYCGKTATSIRLLTAGACPSNPNGKRHVPAN